MKRGRRIIAVLLYLSIVALLLGLHLEELFDLSQFLLVLAGGIILYLPSMEKEDFRHWSKPDYALLARNTIYASYIETFVLLFLFLYRGPEAEQIKILSGMQEEGQGAGTVSGILMRNIALGFRPLLYGICIWIALGSEGRKDISKTGKQTENGRGAGESGKGDAREPDRAYGAKKGLDKGTNGICSAAGDSDRKIAGRDKEVDGLDGRTDGWPEGTDDLGRRANGKNMRMDILDGKANGQGNGLDAADRVSGREERIAGRKGKIWTAQEIYQYFLDSGLTRRETEVALQICKGISNKEIAVELGISETTVKKHVSNIFEKMGVNRREEIYRMLPGDNYDGSFL